LQKSTIFIEALVLFEHMNRELNSFESDNIPRGTAPLNST